MKKFISLMAVIAVLFTVVTITSTTTAEGASAKKYTGSIVCFTDYIKGVKTITKEEAIEKAEAGEPIVLLVGKKIYFVYNEDGTFASKNIAKFAANKKVIVKGTLKTVSNIRCIISTNIESGD